MRDTHAVHRLQKIPEKAVLLSDLQTFAAAFHLTVPQSAFHEVNRNTTMHPRSNLADALAVISLKTKRKKTQHVCCCNLPADKIGGDKGRGTETWRSLLCDLSLFAFVMCAVVSASLVVSCFVNTDAETSSFFFLAWKEINQMSGQNEETRIIAADGSGAVLQEAACVTNGGGSWWGRWKLKQHRRASCTSARPEPNPGWCQWPAHGQCAWARV